MRTFLKNLQNYFIVFFALMSVTIIVLGINRIKKNSPGDTAPLPPSPNPSSNKVVPSGTSGSKGSFTGNTYQTPYGNVVAAIEVKGGKIIAVTMPKVPNSPPSIYAQPYLVNQALKAGNANIQGVSGATYTSIAFKSSLESAIVKAGEQTGTSISGNTVPKTSTPAPSIPRSYRGDDDDDWRDKD
ncbi:MAG: FMN-binding protein [Candidatus Yonathbacteria bacterium]|nr:FMN-binding protein [Candidatus Yonathbacteria bacterium]